MLKENVLQGTHETKAVQKTKNQNHFEKERAVDAIGRRDRKINDREFVGSDRKRVIIIVDYLPYLAAAAC